MPSCSATDPRLNSENIFLLAPDSLQLWATECATLERSCPFQPVRPPLRNSTVTILGTWQTLVFCQPQRQTIFSIALNWDKLYNVWPYKRTPWHGLNIAENISIILRSRPACYLSWYTFSGSLFLQYCFPSSEPSFSRFLFLLYCFPSSVPYFSGFLFLLYCFPSSGPSFSGFLSLLYYFPSSGPSFSGSLFLLYCFSFFGALFLRIPNQTFID